MITIKHLWICVFFSILLVSSSSAQINPSNFDSSIPKTKTSQLDIKGEISELIWNAYSPDPLTGLLSNGISIYKFEDNLIKSRNMIEWGEAYVYAYNNGELQSKSWSGATSGYDLFKRNGNTLHIYNSGDLNRSKATVIYDVFDRIVKVEKLGSTFQIVYENDKKKARLKQLTETKFRSYENKEIDRVITSNYSYTTDEWRGKKVNKTIIKEVFVEERINHESTTITEVLVDENNRTVFLKQFREDGIFKNEYEFYYKNDNRGNWIAKSQFHVGKNRLLWREQRQITYADGLVTGHSEINKEEVQNWSLPKYKNQYYFKKDQSNGNFWLYDNTGASLVGEIGLNNYLNTHNVYSIDLSNNNVIELTNFWNIKDSEFHQAKVMAKSNASFMVIGNDNKVDHVIDGVFVKEENIEVMLLFDNEGFVYDKTTGKSFTVTIPEKTNEIFFSLDELEPSTNGAYCVAFTTKTNKVYYVFIENGKAIPPTKGNFILSGNGEYVKTNLGYYFVENFSKAKPGTIYVPHVVTAQEFNQAKAAFDKLMNSKIAEKSTTANVTVATPETKSSSYFGCGTNDGNCLVNYFNGSIGNLMKQGKTTDEAAKLAGTELEQVFKADPELGYFVIMKIKQDYLIGLMGGLSKESRAQMRAMAMKEVKAYEDKYGSPEIKTVPYKPKKKNDN